MEPRISKDTQNIARGLFDSECDLFECWCEAVDPDCEDAVTGYFEHHDADTSSIDPDDVVWVEVPILIGIKIESRDATTILDREFCLKTLTPALVSFIEGNQYDAVNRASS